TISSGSLSSHPHRLRGARTAEATTDHPHDTRHTLADVLLNAGMPAVDVAAWLGHTTEVMHERYGRSTPGGVREVGTTVGAIYAAAAKRSGSPVRVASTASS